MLKIILTIFISIILTGCMSSTLTQGELLVKSVINCPKNSDMVIMTIPSYGLLGDTSMAKLVQTTHNDGGFLDDFKAILASGTKHIVIYSPSKQKLEAIVVHTLKMMSDGSLSSVTLCLIGINNSSDIISQAKRTGANVIMKIHKD